VNHIVVIAALLLSLGGLVLAWQAWRTRDRRLFAGAAVLWIASTGLWIWQFDAEIGIALALETAALLAYAFILSRIERRAPRAVPERHVVAPPSPRRIGIRIARTLIAGPLALTVTIGIAVAIAVAAPLDEQTRLITAGLLAPSLWACLIVATITARRLWRYTGIMTAAGIAGFAIALLPKV
jgi:hypothetical protein